MSSQSTNCSVFALGLMIAFLCRLVMEMLGQSVGIYLRASTYRLNGDRRPMPMLCKYETKKCPESGRVTARLHDRQTGVVVRASQGNSNTNDKMSNGQNDKKKLSWVSPSIKTLDTLITLVPKYTT